MHCIYCRGVHNNVTGNGSLCDACDDLFRYSIERTRSCKWKEKGRLCSACEVHCFSKEKRAAILQIMRYAGPRLVFTHPLLAFRYLILKQKQKSI
ncbi:MAG: nitrous oxide-stimulated promoter family protein [Spirochaetales bacterium]|nr:nitrous oxide-stimulated promoter family protein [Spirochaetales bacterium]